MVEGNISEGAKKDLSGDGHPSESAPFNRHISVKDFEGEEELHGPENVAEIPTVALISKLASSIGIT
jgi:hypothetical protein